MWVLVINWLSSVLRPLQHSIGYMGDGGPGSSTVTRPPLCCMCEHVTDYRSVDIRAGHRQWRYQTAPGRGQGCTCSWAFPGRSGVQPERRSTARTQSVSWRLADDARLPLRHRRLSSDLDTPQKSIRQSNSTTRWHGKSTQCQIAWLALSEIEPYIFCV